MNGLVLDQPRLAAAVPALRADVRAWATGQGLGDRLAEDLALVVTELASNAVRHGGGERLEVRVHHLDASHGVRVEVTDAGRHAQGPAPAAPDGEGGRGLDLVAALAHAHGRRVDGRGTVAWADVRDAGPGDAATLRPSPGP